MAINAVGLEPAVGFLHDFSNYQTKESLANDLQEPFRWLVDLTVIQAFESKTLQLRDFFTGDDYRYSFEPEAKQRFIELLREQFNSGASYKGRILKWDTIIEEKSTEFGRYIRGRCGKLDFSEPVPRIERPDNRELRKAILALASGDAKKRGIGKSTLHYLRRRAVQNEPFGIHGYTMTKLEPSRTHLPSLMKARS
jgi:CRISPR-associated protein Cas1